MPRVATSVDHSSLVSLEEVLYILREAFARSSRCITASSDRPPRMALLLLEHLHNNTSGKMQSEIDETKRLILEQSVK